MGNTTGIEWTHSTFNIVWGCAKVSPACKHCYAETLARRYGFDVWGVDAERRTFGVKHWSEPLRWNRQAVELGTRHRVFCSSMADVFEDHPTTRGELEKLWPLIRATPQLDWLLLTKRPERIAMALPADWGCGYPNVWLGTTVENNDYVNRLDYLAAVPAVVRFLSVEPLLGPVDRLDLTSISWAIAGGESGNGARPMELAWLRDLRDACVTQKVAFFFKQFGGVRDKKGHDDAVLDGRRWTELPVTA